LIIDRYREEGGECEKEKYWIKPKPLYGVKPWIWNLLVLETKRCRMAENRSGKDASLLAIPAGEHFSRLQ
jgi:hypothetical protein